MKFKPLQQLPAADGKDFVLSDDQRYWEYMKEVTTHREPANITSIDVMHTEPYHFASTSSIRLTLWNSSKCEPISVNSRFKSTVYCGIYRKDGHILGVGTEDGQALFFDINNIQKRGLKNPIRAFQAHKSRINSLAYSFCGRRFVTASDDGHVRMFDLADTRTSSESVWSSHVHSDHVRHCLFSETDNNMLFTGSYDHTVKLWDVRVKYKNSSDNKGVINIDHGTPVEKILIFPKDRIIATAGGTFVKLWDLTVGGKLLHSTENHVKTVTSLCFAGSGAYLLSGGLDQQISIVRTDSGDFSRVHRFRTNGPVLAMAMSSDDKHFAFGTSDTLNFYSRKTVTQPPKPKKRAFQGNELISAPVPKRQTFEKAASKISAIVDQMNEHEKQHPEVDESDQEFTEDSPPSDDDEGNGVEQRDEYVDMNTVRLEKIPLGQFDFLLRSRKYRLLVATMMEKQNFHKRKPELIVAVFQQLRIRQVLQQSLAGHSSENLLNLFRFIKTHLFNSGYFDVLYDVANTTITIYADQQLPATVTKAIVNLKEHVMKEIEAHKMMSSVLGSLNMLIHQTHS